MRYFAKIKTWQKPWWQPKWFRHVINYYWPQQADAETALGKLDIFRLLIGGVFALLLLYRLSKVSELTVSQWQLMFQWSSIKTQNVTNMVLSISFAGLVLLFVLFYFYFWHRHLQLGTKWKFDDALAELGLLPMISSALIVFLVLFVAGGWSSIVLTPWLQMLLILAIGIVIVQYFFIALSWQFYYQHYVSAHPGFKNSMW